MPIIIHPLGVATTGGNDRLILNSRYANLFMKLLAFRYERLRDILGFMKGGFFMSNWDLKSGYYHVPIHPQYRKYFGFKVGNQVFRFNVIFFGYAQACFIFTKIMQEPALERRAALIPVSSYVDDGFTAAATRLACLWQALFAVMLQALLGGYHGLAKCQIDPVLQIKWLGFIIDSVAEKFKVGAPKMEKLKQFLTFRPGKAFSLSPRSGSSSRENNFPQHSRCSSSPVQSNLLPSNERIRVLGQAILQSQRSASNAAVLFTKPGPV
jgi:hypothetical protein